MPCATVEEAVTVSKQRGGSSVSNADSAAGSDASPLF